MTRGVSEGVVTVSRLKELLKLDPKNKTLLPDLLKQAYEQKLVTDEEFIKSSPKFIDTIKCYLFSFVQKPEHLVKIEKYVEAYSLLYTRGSFVANLIAQEKLGPIQALEAVDKFRSNFAVTSPFFNFLEETNSSFKQCFLYERWPSKEQVRLPEIDNILANYPIEMGRLTPNWRSIMSVSGWDNSINSMYTKYRANIENHTVVHLSASLKKYFEKVVIMNGTTRSLLSQLFNKQLRPFSECHNADYMHVVYLRHTVGQHDAGRYMFKDFNYNVNTFDLAMFLKKNLGHESYFPISDLARKYAFLDHKIASFLLNDKTSKTLADIIGFTKENFKKQRIALRKRLRQRYKEMAPSKRSKKLKAKWFRIGSSYFPENSNFVSIQTDGVGVSVANKKPINLYENATAVNINYARDNPVTIGMDTGRAKMFAAAISTCATQKPKTIMFTRGRYYHEMKHNIRMKWERARSANPAVSQANQLLSLHSKVTDLPGYIACVTNNIDVLKAEYFCVERALWKMRLFRLKKKSMSQAVQRLFSAAKNRPLVIGVGDAGFAPTGRGEKAVPTTALMREIFKAKKRYNNRVLVHSINEFRTTMCCCACCSVTEAPMLPTGFRSRRLRFCNNCNQQNGRGLRDRDVQGARNMLWLTQYQHMGIPRPSYLSRNG
jgi:hypothetical protein